MEGKGLFGKGQRAAFAKETILSLILRCHDLPAFHEVTQTVQVPTFCCFKNNNEDNRPSFTLE